MKHICKRLMAALLLICLLASFIVPATFAEDPAQPETVTYDFQLYGNANFQADAAAYTVDTASGHIKTNFDANGKYAGSTSVYNWFYNNYPAKINWGIETSDGSNANVKDYYFRGAKDQGLRLLTGDKGFVSVRIQVPAAGKYDVDLVAGSTASAADIYIFPAATDYVTTRTSRESIIAAMTSANLLINDAVLTANENISLGTKTFDDAGDYIVVFKTEDNFANGVVVRSMTLTPVAAQQETTSPSQTSTTTEAAVEGQDTQFDFDLANQEAFSGLNGKTLAKKDTYGGGTNRALYKYLESLYPNTLNWVHTQSSFTASGGVKWIEVRKDQGLRITGAVGDWVAIRLTGIIAGMYDITLTGNGPSTMNTVNTYLVKETADLVIADSMTDENLLLSGVKDSGSLVARQQELEDGDYILIVKHTAVAKSGYWCLTKLSLTAVEPGATTPEETTPEETTPEETTPEETTQATTEAATVPTEETTKPAETVPPEAPPAIENTGNYIFDIVNAYPEHFGDLSGKTLGKKITPAHTGREVRIYQYLETLYGTTLHWIHQQSDFQKGGGVANIQIRGNQGLRIYGTVNDWTAIRLNVPAADEYNLMLTSGGSNTVNLYLMEYTEGMDIAAGMTEENLLIENVKAADTAAIAEKLPLEQKEYVLAIKHTSSGEDTYWYLKQLQLQPWAEKQPVPVSDELIYDLDLAAIDSDFLNKALSSRLNDGVTRGHAKLAQMYADGQANWKYEGCSETFLLKELSFRTTGFRLKAGENMNMRTDPWAAFRIKNPGTDTYDVRIVSKDKSAVCVNIYIIPVENTLVLTPDQVRAAMTRENLLVSNAQIDDKGTFYLGEYTFGVEDEYVLVMDFIKGAAMHLARIEMTKDGLVADGTVKHGTTYNGVVYDLDMADAMDGVYTDSTVYMPDVIDDMNSRWASGAMNWKFMRASEDLSGATTATTSKPSDKLRFYRSSGMRVYSAPDSWVALKIKSPGSGEFTVTINHAACPKSGTVAMYILPADTDPAEYWNATDPTNRVGKAVLTNQYGETGTVDGSTAFVGYWNFEAGKEYILVLEAYEASAFDSTHCYMNISQIIMQRGRISYEQKEGDKKVTAMAVAPNALPAAEPCTSAVIQEINGHDWYFLPVEGGYLLVYDLDTGTLVDKVKTPFSRVDHNVGLMDGKILMGGKFIYDPYTGETDTLPNIKATPGFEEVQGMTGILVDPDGVTIWFGCNYGAQMGSYNLETREYTYYGQPYGYQNRITGLIRRGDYLYGCVHGDTLNKIFKWDINTKKVVADYDVNDLMGTASYIRSLGLLGDDYIVMCGSDFADFVVLDPDTMEAVDIGLFSYPNLEITEEIDGKQYMMLVKYGLYEYDIATKTVTKVPGFGTEGIGFRTGAYRGNSNSVVTLDGDTCLFTYTSSGGHPRLFNLTTKEYEAWDNLVLDNSGGSPLRTFLSWGEGSNRFSFGGFNTDLCAVFNTELGKVEFYYKTGGQTDTHIWYDGKLYVPNYSSTTLNEVYPDETQTSLPVTNDVIQRWRLDHEETGQKRLHSSAAGDGYVFVGTTPDSNLLGGGIVVYDTNTGRWFLDREPVENGSINGMQYHDGLLYCTTSNAGGSGSEIDPNMSAMIFVYDYKNKEVVATLDPRDYITGLASPVRQVHGVTADPKVDENGRFWSVVSDVLFCFTFDKETKTFNVQEVISFTKSKHSDASADNWWSKSILFDTENNYIYACFSNGGGSQQIKIENWDAPVGQVKVSENKRFMADSISGNYALIGDDGNLYYANGSDVKMYPLNLTDEDWAIAEKVDAMFLAIGDEITLESEAAIKSARSAYENLSWRYKALIQKLEVLQEAESDILECKIATLEGLTMTADDFPAMTELIDEYKGLNARQQRYVKNYDLLKEKYNQASDLNDQRIAAAMQKRIDALADKLPVTLDDEPEVVQIRADYKTLTGKQSLLVDTTILEDAEAQIKELRSEFVKYVETLIQAIPDEITLSAEEAVTAAREAADKLYTGERKEVSYSKLTSAEGKLRTLKNAKTKAEEVDALIDAIGVVTLGDKERIAEAREAYDALNGTALTFVRNGKKLETAEFILKALQTWAIPAMAVVAVGAGFCVVWFVPSLRSKVFKTKKKEETEGIDN